jgi:hypothetical protein
MMSLVVSSPIYGRPVIGGRALMTVWSCTCSRGTVIEAMDVASEDHAAWIIAYQPICIQSISQILVIMMGFVVPFGKLRHKSCVWVRFTQFNRNISFDRKID